MTNTTYQSLARAYHVGGIKIDPPVV